MPLTAQIDPRHIASDYRQPFDRSHFASIAILHTFAFLDPTAQVG